MKIAMACISILLSLVGCKEDPGLDVDLCTIGRNGVVLCHTFTKDRPNYRLNVSEMTGYTCVSPQHLGNAQIHHAELHEKLSHSIDTE